MELKHKLLDHPFYQAWAKGEVTKEQLANYHSAYSEFIELMPQFWQKINTAFKLDNAAAIEIVEDEKSHIPLWADWSYRLPTTTEYSRMSELIDTMKEMTPSELLGAVQAFEKQQPEVAETKKAGLIEFYGFNESDTRYFDEHMEEEEHIEYGNSIRDNYADTTEYEAGFHKGAELLYRGLDLFLN